LHQFSLDPQFSNIFCWELLPKSKAQWNLLNMMK
jgi:hypothetical protein